MSKTVACFTFLVLVQLTPTLTAQDPFGGGDDDSDLFGGDPAASATAPAAGPVEVEQDPLVLSLRESNPRTAEELIAAVEILLNIGRADEAQRYLKTLADADLDRAALVKLHNRFGSGLFFRILRDTRVGPLGADFSGAVLDAAYQDARSPARLQALVEQLSHASPEQRRMAAVDLQAGGQDAAAVLVNVLADSQRSSEHARVRSALVRLGRISHEPLIAALRAGDNDLRAQAMVTLGRLNATAAVPFLLRPLLAPGTDQRLRRAAAFALRSIVGTLPTSRDAQLFLSRRIKDQLALEPNTERSVTVWAWDESKRQIRGSEVSASDAALAAAYAFARELHALAPGNEDHQQLYLLTLLESAKRSAGWDQPLSAADPQAHSAAAAAGVEPIEKVLSAAMRESYVAAAIGAIEILADLGDQRVLYQAGGRPRTLAQALRHTNRRIRFAAAMSILELDPQQAFPGSSYLPEALSYFLQTLGTPRALVVHPRLETAQTLVGLLAELGYEADTAASGTQALRLATRSSDYEFVLISDAVLDPAVNELLQQFRRDPRTGELPIGLMARQANYRQMVRRTTGDPLAEAFPRPHDLTTVVLATRRLLQRGAADRVPFERRLYQARAALDQLANLAAEPAKYGFYDLLRYEQAVERVVLHSSLSSQAARVLGLFGTPSAQRVLVTVASQAARPLIERQNAAAAFATAVQNRGLLLSRREILLQYELYNGSADQPRETQLVLGSILDAIEAPSRERLSANAN